MSRELYFIPILARALARPDIRTALNEAFREIARVGQRSEYRQGYDNFQRFMEEVVRQVAGVRLTAMQENGAREWIAELATNTFEGTTDEHQWVHAWVHSRPEWAAEYAALRNEIAEKRSAEGAAQILVTRGSTSLARISLSQQARQGFVYDVSPGGYAMFLDTGRLIWEGDLTEQDLIWTVAFPDRALDLAAANRRGTRCGNPAGGPPRW